ncbi:MAG TPA: MBL fold metallo-hydrolase, partial [Flavisolibacter sp.]
MKNFNIHKQHPRTGKMLAVVLALLTFFCSGTAQAQGIKIHQLGLGDGDCALIEVIDYSPLSTHTNPVLDTAVILIDAQRNKSAAASEIYKFIDSRLGALGLNRKKIDYVLLSHVHIDHYGNMIKALTELLDNDYEISYVFDRLALNVTNMSWTLDDVDECYDELVTDKMSASASRYHKFINENLEDGYYPILAGQDMFQNRFINARMLCLAAFGSALSATNKDPQFFIPWNGSAYKPKSENDLSFAFLLSYGGFRYFTGGDLGGQDHSGYANGEVPVGQYLVAKAGTNFHFCAFKVSHHGSSESSAPAFLSLVKPTVAVIPASLRAYGKSTNPLPTCATLDNLAGASVAKVVFTFVPKGDLKVPANYCKFQNLDHTQDVTLAVNLADLQAAITMRLTYQGRDGDYAVSGPPTTE